MCGVKLHHGRAGGGGGACGGEALGCSALPSSDFTPAHTSLLPAE